MTDATACGSSNPANTPTTCASGCQSLFSTVNSACAGALLPGFREAPPYAHPADTDLAPH